MQLQRLLPSETNTITFNNILIRKIMNITILNTLENLYKMAEQARINAVRMLSIDPDDQTALECYQSILVLIRDIEK